MSDDPMRINAGPLDRLTDGLQEGLITQLYGEFATGKSTYCIQAAAAVSREGKKTAYIDTEGGFSPERARQIGGASCLPDIQVYRPGSLDEQTALVRSLASDLGGDVGLIAFDSFVSLYKVDAPDMERRSELVCDLSLQLLLLSRIARERGIPVIITNHVYEDFSRDVQVPVGGHTLKYWSKVIVSLEKTGASRRKAVLVRHPYLPEGRSCYVALSDAGMGVDE